MRDYNIYEQYVPSVQGGVIGNWEKRGDTLFLTPQKEYCHLQYWDIRAENLNISSIPQIFIIKNSSQIIDITNYKKGFQNILDTMYNAGILDSVVYSSANIFDNSKPVIYYKMQ